MAPIYTLCAVHPVRSGTLVVVLNDESKAYEGSRALYQLDGEGSIAIHAESAVKTEDGKATVKQAEGDFSALLGEQRSVALSDSSGDPRASAWG